MPSRGIATEPRAYLTSGAWPEGILVPEAPPEAHLVAGIATRLNGALDGRSLRSVAKDAGVSVGTVSALLAGRTWGDVVTVARLERALGVELWGREHAREIGVDKSS